MGVVAECTHLALGERVAIKMLRPDVLGDQDAVQRFIREAQAAAKLKSEYVARVSDVGRFENGVPYMVMEFLEGLDLGQLLEQRGVLPAQWATELVLQTAEALSEAHALGIVHRDVKPTNLFVSWRPDGTSLIKVLDFGISKSPTGADMQLTQTQSLLGTPAYMSPEQMRSARLVDTRTDIWSLGTVFYEILEGRRPFEAESFSEMCVKVAVDPPAPMVNTPPAMQQVILHCLAKSPEQRYSSMADLGRDLVPFAQDPHAAQLLVERMARLLRRQHDFESSTGTRIPRNTADLGSGPVRTPAPWEPKSDPSAVPYVPAPQAPPARPGSAPYVGPETLLVKPRRRWPLVIGVAGLLAATGIAVAVVATRDTGTTTEAVAKPAEIKLPETKPVEVKPPDRPVETNPEIVTDPKPSDTDPKPVDVKLTDTKAKPTDTKVHQAIHQSKLPIKHDPVAAKKADDAKLMKLDGSAAGTGSATTAPPKKEPCDAFASLHGCR